MSEQVQRGDELFETLSKNKKKRRNKIIRTVLTVIAVIAAILVGLVFYLRHRVEQKFAAAAADVKSHVVTPGTIHTVVTGSGTLTQVDVEDITVPTGVEILEVLVEAQDQVSAGDVLATVDMASVMTTLADVQSQLNDLDKEISNSKGDTADTTVTAGVAGRVKRILAEKDTDVTACMAENGALAYISLDGHMAVEIEADKLEKSAQVTVVREDGKAIEGTVESVAGGKAVVLLTDNGPRYDEEVTVLGPDGTEAGKGKLYIHSPLAVTGYAGTVSQVRVKENAKVSSNSAVFTLKDTGFTANYDTLLRDRADLEETLLDLLNIYRYGAVTAPFDGTVSTVLFDEDGEKTQTGVLTLFPGESMSILISIDETDILALKEGQEAEVVVSSVSDEVRLGEVTEINKEATTTAGVTVYSAEITVDNGPGMLPGMTADVDVKIEGVENALIIPVDALHQTSTIQYVYTSYDPETGMYGSMVEVTSGMQNDKEVEILTGLKEGDTVYYVESTNPLAFMFQAMSGGMGGGMGGGQRASGGMPGGAPGARQGG